MIEQKIKALADVLNIEESEIQLGPFGYVANTCTYEVLCNSDEVNDMLESELAFERQCAEGDLEEGGYEWIIPYVDFDKYFRDNAFCLEDFGFNRYIINDVTYYIREV